jgi:hypothetical protein
MRANKLRGFKRSRNAIEEVLMNLMTDSSVAKDIYAIKNLMSYKTGVFEYSNFTGLYQLNHAVG